MEINYMTMSSANALTHWALNTCGTSTLLTSRVSLFLEGKPNLLDNFNRVRNTMFIIMLIVLVLSSRDDLLNLLMNSLLWNFNTEVWENFYSANQFLVTNLGFDAEAECHLLDCYDRNICAPWALKRSHQIFIWNVENKYSTK